MTNKPNINRLLDIMRDFDGYLESHAQGPGSQTADEILVQAKSRLKSHLAEIGLSDYFDFAPEPYGIDPSTLVKILTHRRNWLSRLLHRI